MSTFSKRLALASMFLLCAQVSRAQTADEVIAFAREFGLPVAINAISSTWEGCFQRPREKVVLLDGLRAVPRVDA